MVVAKDRQGRKTQKKYENNVQRNVQIGGAHPRFTKIIHANQRRNTSKGERKNDH